VDYESKRRTSLDPAKSISREDLSNEHRWLRIVEDYTQRDLTVIHDKLPALSSLAHEYQAISSDKYLAGLWLKHLKRQLLWCAVNPKRPPTYIAPSWSWASVDSPVRFRGHGFFQAGFKIVDASVDISGGNPLGQVKSGVIILESRVQLFRYKADATGTYKLQNRVGHLCPWFQPDEDLPTVPQEFTFVNIFEEFGLVLLPLENSPGTYRRIGAAKISTSGNFFGQPHVEPSYQTISIV
jgi:hypothetical protein